MDYRGNAITQRNRLYLINGMDNGLEDGMDYGMDYGMEHWEAKFTVFEYYYTSLLGSKL